MSRCAWGNETINQQYHDTEWGKPIHDEQQLFEALTLELMQAGLSWKTIMKKRDNFKLAFSNWDYNQVAQYDQNEIEALVQDASIIRHRQKIEAVVANAQCIQKMQNQAMSFDDFIWHYTQGQVLMNHWSDRQAVPSKTELAETISRDLKRLGFKFVGPTTIYAFLQAIGVVNDHIESCEFKYK